MVHWFLLNRPVPPWAKLFSTEPPPVLGAYGCSSLKIVIAGPDNIELGMMLLLKITPLPVVFVSSGLPPSWLAYWAAYSLKSHPLPLRQLEIRCCVGTVSLLDVPTF